MEVEVGEEKRKASFGLLTILLGMYPTQSPLGVGLHWGRSIILVNYVKPAEKNKKYFFWGGGSSSEGTRIGPTNSFIR